MVNEINVMTQAF